MGVYAFLAVFGGAGVGAWLRWMLGLRLNPLFPTLPLGTLAANLIGGYLIGVAVAYFSYNSSVPPEIRLLIITGFMGGLTTFSTFSAEVLTLLSRDQYVWAAVLTALHLGGSLLLTGLGILTIKMLVVKA
jgi:CrcB protein